MLTKHIAKLCATLVLYIYKTSVSIVHVVYYACAALRVIDSKSSKQKTRLLLSSVSRKVADLSAYICIRAFAEVGTTSASRSKGPIRGDNSFQQRAEMFEHIVLQIVDYRGLHKAPKC